MRHVKPLIAAAVIGACSLPVGALAQTGSQGSPGSSWDRDRGSSQSWIPGTSYGYVGGNLGTTHWQTPCTFNCDSADVAGKLYTGGLFSNVFGLELGYINMGEAERMNGKWRAQGANVSLVGNIPAGPLNLFAKVGATYGWTRSSAAPGANVATGNNDGVGLSYGAGVGVDITKNVQALAEWDRHEFRFVAGREPVHMYSLGIKYKF